jgi:phosphoenolpyruvate-protein kinase (PTS system EI component)
LWKEPAQRASSRVTIKTLHPGFNKRKEITQRQRQMKQVENELRQEREDTKKVF